MVADVQVCILFDPNGNQSKNHPRLHHPAGGGSLCKEADDVVLRSLAHAAFQRQGLAGHILEIRHGQLDADTANLRLSVAVVAHGRHLDVGLESVRVGVPELLELGRPCQRADHVDVDAVLAPLGGGDAGHTADALLGGSIAALAIVAKQAGARGKVDHGALGLLQVRIGLLHVQIGSIQTGVNGQVKLIHGVIGDGHARGAGLSIVDDGVDAAELLNGLVDDVLDNGLVVLTGRDIGLNRQNLDAALGLEGLLGSLELGNVAAGNDEVCALSMPEPMEPAEPSLSVALPPPVTITVLPVKSPIRSPFKSRRAHPSTARIQLHAPKAEMQL